MSENLGTVAERFVEHRRALGRKYLSEARELRLLVRFAEAQGIHELDHLTTVSRSCCQPLLFRSGGVA